MLDYGSRKVNHQKMINDLICIRKQSENMLSSCLSFSHSIMFSLPLPGYCGVAASAGNDNIHSNFFFSFLRGLCWGLWTWVPLELWPAGKYRCYLPSAFPTKPLESTAVKFSLSSCTKAATTFLILLNVSHPTYLHIADQHVDAVCCCAHLEKTLIIILLTWANRNWSWAQVRHQLNLIPEVSVRMHCSTASQSKSSGSEEHGPIVISREGWITIQFLISSLRDKREAECEGGKKSGENKSILINHFVFWKCTAPSSTALNHTLSLWSNCKTFFCHERPVMLVGFVMLVVASENEFTRHH